MLISISAGMELFGCPNDYETSCCSAEIVNTAISELHLRDRGRGLPGQIGVAAIRELNQRLLMAHSVLRVGVTAIEKCGHGGFNQAGSGPRSMA